MEEKVHSLLREISKILSVFFIVRIEYKGDFIGKVKENASPDSLK